MCSLITMNKQYDTYCYYIGSSANLVTVISPGISSLTTHFIPPGMYSDRVSHLIGHLITHRASHHPLGILSYRAGQDLSGISSHLACHPNGNLTPPGNSSHRAYHDTPGISLPTGHVMNLTQDLWKVLKTPLSGGMIASPIGVGIASDDEISSLFSPVSDFGLPCGFQVAKDCLDCFFFFFFLFKFYVYMQPLGL